MNTQTDTRQQLLDNILSIVAELENHDTDTMEWLDEQLNIETIMRSPSGEFMGAEILCACGGPDIRIDTRWETVTGHWGTDSIERGYTDNISLNDLLEEIFPA
ncbi:MAG: hypothetical protein R8K20_03505 [Gallionellaceae bacterium]